MLIATTPTIYQASYSAYVEGARQQTEANLQIYLEPQSVAPNVNVLRTDSSRILDIYA